MNKILIIGHGRRMWNARTRPRCAPMDIAEWNILVQDKDPDTLIFLDFNIDEQPDILENMLNDWRIHVDKGAFNIIIDASSHLMNRKSYNFWKSVQHALTDYGGLYIGWDDAKNMRGRTVRFSKQDIDENVERMYGKLSKRTKNYGLLPH